MNTLLSWWQRYVAPPEFFVLWFTILATVAFVAFFGHLLIPVFLSIIFAYLLDGMVKRLDACKVPHALSVSIICLFSLSIILLIAIWLLPLLWNQLANLIAELPKMMKQGEKLLMALPEKYPDFISAKQLNEVLSTFQMSLTRAGKVLLSYSIANISNIIEIVIYFILVPLMVFFFLKDNKKIINWCVGFIPKTDSYLLKQVWHEINQQLALYVRGKVLEILIVGGVTAVTFILMRLNYAILLAALVGIATIIPFIGAIVVTIPVILIAYLQWGWSMPFLYLVIAYTVITALDGNLLVPLLFSETMELHPVVVIIAIIIFGGLFGFWGVFFAIPLATVVRAVMNALRA